MFSRSKASFLLIIFSFCLFFGIGLKLKNQPNVMDQQVANQEEIEVTFEVTTTIPETTTIAVETTKKETTTRKETTTKKKPVVTTTKPVKKTTTSDGISYTNDELDFMAAAICQESGGESDYVRIRVANVMVNRVLSSYFPDTIEGVLTQKVQYDLYSGRNFPSWATEENIQDCYAIAISVLNGTNRPFPENVVFQAGFKQGSGVYEHCNSVLGGSGYYFCYI